MNQDLTGIYPRHLMQMGERSSDRGSRQPLVSVVMPCYNDEAYLEEAVESALIQTYPCKEVILIDDGSTDDSFETIQSFGDQVRWERQANQGAPAARNRGLELAKGKYVKFLDADDVLRPEAIESQVSQIESSPKKQKTIVYGEAIWVDEEGDKLPGHDLRPRGPDEDPVAHILSSNPLTSCPLHEKKYLQEVGGFDPSVPRGQEFDLHLRLVLTGVSFRYHPEPVYRYRHYEDESRISGQDYGQGDPLDLRKVVLRHEQLIREYRGELTEQIRVLLARRLWAYGRGILREGEPSIAGAYFSEAYRLAGRKGIEGNFPYPLLASCMSPKYAETCIEVLKDVVSPLRTPFQ